MPKKTESTTPETPLRLVPKPEIKPPIAPAPAPAPTYTYRTKVRCPRCGSINTTCKDTYETSAAGYQMRRCRAGDCGAKFRVDGERI